MQYPHSSHLLPSITTSPYNTTIALRGQRVVQKKQWPFLQSVLSIADFASTTLPAVSAELPIPPATWSSFAKRVKPVFVCLSSTHTSLCFLENSFVNKFMPFTRTLNLCRRTGRPASYRFGRYVLRHKGRQPHNVRSRYKYLR